MIPRRCHRNQKAEARFGTSRSSESRSMYGVGSSDAATHNLEPTTAGWPCERGRTLNDVKAGPCLLSDCAATCAGIGYADRCEASKPTMPSVAGCLSLGWPMHTCLNITLDTCLNTCLYTCPHHRWAGGARRAGTAGFARTARSVARLSARCARAATWSRTTRWPRTQWARARARFGEAARLPRPAGTMPRARATTQRAP